ncbi:sensor histidine kinase [Microvirga solisilvae]|uniref:sensor histidine kinase n=1 Tax=Microvirga solisilvae TaxID=2919498 RepID=UPI001FAF3A16|nr:sensor histidine kinase [Microvirga solisilvae]
MREAPPETLPRQGLSLINQFLCVAFGVMIVGMLAMGAWVSSQIEESVAELKSVSMALSVNSNIAPHLQELASGNVLSKQSILDLNRVMDRPDLRANVTSLRIWKRDGLIVYSSEPDLIGKKFPLNPYPRQAWAGAVKVQLNGLAYEEDASERAKGVPLLEVFVPIYDLETSHVIAVAEFHERADVIKTELTASKWQTWITTAVITLNMMGCLFIIVANAGKTIDRQRVALVERVAQLSALLHENRSLKGRIEKAAQKSTENNERFMRRMGYDLHDGVAQLVGLALLRLGRVEGSEREQDNLQKIRSALSDALTDIRNICKGLLLPEVEKLSLDEALLLMIRQHELRTGTTVSRQIAYVPQEAPHFVKIALCRFVQECLNNTFKHADGVGQRVHASWDGARITIEVADDGPGIHKGSGIAPTPSLGLSGLRDRIESIGGIVIIKSVPGVGTSFKACLSLSAGEMDAA